MGGKDREAWWKRSPKCNLALGVGILILFLCIRPPNPSLAKQTPSALQQPASGRPGLDRGPGIPQSPDAGAT